MGGAGGGECCRSADFGEGFTSFSGVSAAFDSSSGHGFKLHPFRCRFDVTYAASHLLWAAHVWADVEFKKKKKKLEWGLKAQFNCGSIYNQTGDGPRKEHVRACVCVCACHAHCCILAGLIEHYTTQSLACSVTRCSVHLSHTHTK